MAYWMPLANGLRTDHPVPGLAFVDDEHIPVEDGDAVEAVGRHDGVGSWGRHDRDQDSGEWSAFTTDPKNPSVGWLIRFHPEHGRSVLLYRDSDATSAYDWFGERAMLTRLGGYWWDGTRWYRPLQVIDWASEGYARREVARPTVVSAADLLDGTGRAEAGRLARIMQLGGDQAPVELAGYQLQGSSGAGVQWRHELALWASRRPVDARPLKDCVVTLTAPELVNEALLGVEEFAAEAQIGASTLRAYIARDEADVPAAQAVDGPRKRWSKPVAMDWAEQRRRDPGAVAALLTTSIPGRTGDGDEESDGLAPGLRALWQRLTEVFIDELWRDSAARRRWSRPYRTEQAAGALSKRLGWYAALHLDSTVPFDTLASVIQDAVLKQMGDDYRKSESRVHFGRPLGRMLGWFVQQRPSRVSQLFGSIIGEAERKLEIPREVTIESLRGSIEFDGGVEAERLDEFLDLVSPPRSQSGQERRDR